MACIVSGIQNEYSHVLTCRLPDDIWVVDLDSTKLTPPTGGYDEIPPLPEPEGTILKNHLKQVSPYLASSNGSIAIHWDFH